MRIIIIGLLVLCLIFLQSKIYERLWYQNLKVSLSFAHTELTEGEDGQIKEIIENRKNYPLLTLKVKFQTSRNLEFEDVAGSKTTDLFYRNDVFHIDKGVKITRTIPFRAGKRGYYTIKNIDLVGSDLFFTTETITNTTTDCYLYVFPKEFYSEDFHLSLQKLNGDILVKRHLLEDPFEYRGIREYQPFDDMRSVNWKATAKTGDLKVNQKNYTAMQTVRIFLNTEDTRILKKEKEVEASIQIVKSLATFFLAQNMKISFYTNAKDILTESVSYLDAGSGLGQLDALNKILARIDTKQQAASFCELYADDILEKNDDIINLFVSANGYEDFIKLLHQCNEQGNMYTWFYPCRPFNEPSFPDGIQSHVNILHFD